MFRLCSNDKENQIVVRTHNKIINHQSSSSEAEAEATATVVCW